LEPARAHEIVQKVVEQGRERGWTKLGEFFDAQHLADSFSAASAAMAAADASSPASWNFTSPATALASGEDLIKEFIDNGPFTVCYDCDHDHRPILSRGERAHWAAVVGVVLPIDRRGSGAAEDWVVVRHGKTRRLQFFRAEELWKSSANLQRPRSKPGEEGMFVMPERLEECLAARCVRSQSNQRL
jgi:hypothetical protein